MANTNNRISVCGIVVTYRPDMDRLAALLAAARPQMDRLVMIDNGSDVGNIASLCELCSAQDFVLVEMEKNIGLAAALNKGIQWAGEKNSSHVLLLDQDSIPMPGMVARLQTALAELKLEGKQVAGVGPVITDPRLRTRSPFVTFGSLGVKRRRCGNKEGLDKHLPADFLISSGTLAPLDVFEKVGVFDAGLFIDNVDLEWCFRARAKGFRCYGVCDAELEHYLGDRVGRIWLGRWMPIYYHAPIRQYYIMRNRILLYKKKYSPTGWILQDIARVLFKLIIFSLFAKNRLQNLRMMRLGFLDGVRGRAGECIHKHN